MVFHWRLSDCNSPQVSGTLLSILAVFNNAVVWMVHTRSPTSIFSRPFKNPLVIVPNATITIGIFVTIMFHSFFNSLARSRYLSLFSHSFSFILWSAGKFICLSIFFCPSVLGTPSFHVACLRLDIYFDLLFRSLFCSGNPLNTFCQMTSTTLDTLTVF